MKKKEQYIKIENLSVSKVLFDFINNELLKGLNIKKKRYLSEKKRTIYKN